MAIKNNRKSYIVEHDGKQIEITTIHREKYGKARVYGAVDAFAGITDPTFNLVLFDSKTQPRLWANLTPAQKYEMEKGLKEYRSYKRKALANTRKALSAVTVHAGNEHVANMCNHVSEFKFSQNAGCSCPCSPGFIADTVIYDGSSPNGVDIHISIV